MPKHLVRVRALSNVMGLRYGDVVEVVATPRVEILIHGGHLEWVDEAGVKVVESAEPVMSDASFDDEPIFVHMEHPLIEDVTLEEAAAEVKKVRKLRSVKASDDE